MPINHALLITKEKREEIKEQERLASFPNLSSRQFWLAANEINITKDDVISACGEDEELVIIVKETTNFVRSDSVIDELAEILNIPVSQLDDLWLWAAGK